MIFVKRGPAPPVLDLTDPASLASGELAQAKQHWNDTGLAISTEAFKVYKNPQVQNALRDMFHGKCAYCESQAAGSADTDVEHYRPKGKVSDKDGHPGYWWLAMDWSNLVLGCMHCNQRRRQMIFSPNQTEEEIRQAILDNRLKSTGKLDTFPTEDDIWVMESGTSVADEKPLLIDPTVTDPEPLLDWFDRKDFALVGPRGGNARAQKTIDTLGLNRRRLCEERMTKLALLTMKMQDVRAGLEAFEAAASPGEADMVVRFILRDLALIEAMADARQHHAALARDFLARARAAVNAALPPP